MKQAKNVLGEPLAVCCLNPKTGFLRDGYCQFTPQDRGAHLVCAVMTKEFLDFSKYLGNDLITPRPEFDFPGLKPGDRWCLCATRWKEAYDNEVAPKVVLQSTDEMALKIISLDLLKKFAH
jgi:uncharacterized protein (DUF2237 family)